MPVLDLIDFGRRMYERDLLVAMDGNVSARRPDGTYLCSRAGTHKGFLEPSDFVVVDSDGKKLSGEGEPTTEIFLHLAAYQERPDVGAVLHAHPPHAIACTLAGISLEDPILAEVILTLGTVPVVPYATTGSKALAEACRPHFRLRDAILLERHGAVVLGRTPLEAFCRLETLEHLARILLLAHRVRAPTLIPRPEAIHLRKLGLGRYGGPPEAVAMRDREDADLPLPHDDGKR